MSGSRRSSFSSTKSTSSRSSSRYSPTRHAVPERMEPGCMFNLPDRKICEDIVGSLPLQRINEGIFNHPVVFLEANGDEARILVTSTLDGKSLEDYHSDQPHVQMEHMPILPAQPHYLTNERLEFENGLEMPRGCYVKIRNAHQVPLACLYRAFRNGRNQEQLRLTQDSLTTLIWAMDHVDDRFARCSSPYTLPSPSSLPSPPPLQAALSTKPKTSSPLASTAFQVKVKSFKTATVTATRNLEGNWRKPAAEGTKKKAGFSIEGNWRKLTRSSKEEKPVRCFEGVLRW